MLDIWGGTLDATFRPPMCRKPAVLPGDRQVNNSSGHSCFSWLLPGPANLWHSSLTGALEPSDRVARLRLLIDRCPVRRLYPKLKKRKVTEAHMKKKTLLHLAAFGASCGLMLLALHGAASANPPHGGPEIDAGSAAAGLAVLGTGILLLLERFRHR
jgi:hypothetical protein